MVRSAVASRGTVETDAEVPADTRRIDLWFMPDPACEPAPGYLGLLGRITAGPSTLEFFHNTPSGDELADCLIKHGQFRHNTESSIIRRAGFEVIVLVGATRHRSTGARHYPARSRCARGVVREAWLALTRTELLAVHDAARPREASRRTPCRGTCQPRGPALGDLEVLR